MMRMVPAELVDWLWFALGGLLLLAELVVPGAQLVWLGLAALATGVLAPLSGLGWQGQLVLFAGLAVVAVLAGRAVAARRGAVASDRPFLNRRAEALIGREFELVGPIVGGVGHVRVDDSLWRVEGQESPDGARVVVVAVDGAVLRVRRVGDAG